MPRCISLNGQGTDCTRSQGQLRAISYLARETPLSVNLGIATNLQEWPFAPKQDKAQMNKENVYKLPTASEAVVDDSGTINEADFNNLLKAASATGGKVYKEAVLPPQLWCVLLDLAALLFGADVAHLTLTLNESGCLKISCFEQQEQKQEHR